MTTPFSEDTVYKRTAARLGTNETRVRMTLDMFMEEWIKHARETDPELIRGTSSSPVPEAVQETPAPPAKKARAPRKSRAKGTTPAKGKATAQGESTGDRLGNALVDSLTRREAEASVRLDGETQSLGEPNSSDTTTPELPDGTPPPPTEAPRVTADA